MKRHITTGFTMKGRERTRLAMEQEAHFVEVGFTSVKSCLGFEIRFLGRFELLYQEGERRLVVPLDRLKDALLVEFSRVSKWEPPFEDEELPSAKRDEVERNLGAALKRMRLGFRIE